VESYPLVRTSIGGGESALIIDTQLLDLEEENLKWKYYSKNKIPKKFLDGRDIFLSPSEELFCLK
jgi:hypothetical protein